MIMILHYDGCVTFGVFDSRCIAYSSSGPFCAPFFFIPVGSPLACPVAMSVANTL
ncbi:hypothetical protein BDN67DRAFT_695475 [Paxillus ammoniavirescens]|nr:hypothetical protein BDN67DRAFT_695475 [Paxillus ammoniavirescens]